MDQYVKGLKVGEGTFGIVYEATHKLTGKKVALKKIRLVDVDDGVHPTAIREIKLLAELKHANVIELSHVFRHNSNVYLAFDFMDTDLEMIINDPQVSFAAADVKSYMKMILSGVAYCHRCYVLHRDLKPGNLLVGSDGQLKLCDFGLARMYASPDARYTSEVVTRWYRAPELLFGSKNYGPAIDMWSVGCIFAELMLRKPLFAGERDIDQLGKIFHALGTPTEESWPGMSSLPEFVRYESCPGTNLKAIFPAAAADALDLLSKLLQINPNKRLTAEEALKHQYFSNNPPPRNPLELPKLSKTSKFVSPPARTSMSPGRVLFQTPCSGSSMTPMSTDGQSGKKRKLDSVNKLDMADL